MFLLREEEENEETDRQKAQVERVGVSWGRADTQQLKLSVQKEGTAEGGTVRKSLLHNLFLPETY